MSDLTFYEQMYQAGAKGSFDVLAVNVYGLGEPPDDRRLSADRFNVSRPILVHDIMTRYGDTTTPVWATEFGYNSLPKGWTGEPSIWGPNVDEQTQARYLVGGLTRMKEEWPWMGDVFIWGFRWAERPGTFGNDSEAPSARRSRSPTSRSSTTISRPARRGTRCASSPATRPSAPGAPPRPIALIQPGPGWERSGDGTARRSRPARRTRRSRTLYRHRSRGDRHGRVGASHGGRKGSRHDAARRHPANGMTRLASNLPDGPHTVVLRSTAGRCD